MKLDLVVKFAKLAAAGVVANGTRKIVAGIVENNVTIGKPKDKIAVAAATWVIAGIVATAAKKYSDDSIDSAVNGVREGVTWIQKNKTKDALVRINKGESTFEKENLDESNFVKVDGLWEVKEEEPSEPADS